MPRNTGTNLYAIPPDTEGIPDQTIESVTYNTYIHDVEKDLNDPRPILAGGTGANDAAKALVNLGAEKATQLVSEYDAHIWIPGSFRSASTATGAPVNGHAFAGIVYLNEPYVTPPTNENVVVSARDMNDTVVPSRVYVREKKANLWGPWAIIDASTTTFPPSGGLSATTILAAIQELDAEKASLTFVAATYAPINSPLFTGDARAPTPLVNDNDTTIATTAHVKAYIATIPLAGNAAPIDAMAYGGLQLNGSIGAGTAWIGGPAAANNTYVTDGWKLGKAGTMGVGLSLTDFQYEPDLLPLGFKYGLHMDVTTAQSSLGSNDFACITQPIEGYRILKLAWGTAGAQPITIGFWSANSRAGIYSVAVTGPSGYSCATTYTQNVASVYQYNTVTIPGPTNGTFNNNYLLGCNLHFTLAAGSGVTATAANTWYGFLRYAAPGQINGVSAVGADVLLITGVVVFPGIVSIPVARSAFLMRPVSEEDLLLRRYYQKKIVANGTAVSMGQAQNSTLAFFPLPYTAMRYPPHTISLSSTAHFCVLDVSAGPIVTSMTPSHIGLETSRMEVTTPASLTPKAIVLLQAIDELASVTIDARL